MELDTLRFLLAIARNDIEARAHTQEQAADVLFHGAVPGEDVSIRRAEMKGRVEAYRDVCGTLDRLIRLVDGHPF